MQFTTYSFLILLYNVVRTCHVWATRQEDLGLLEVSRGGALASEQDDESSWNPFAVGDGVIDEHGTKGTIVKAGPYGDYFEVRLPDGTKKWYAAEALSYLKAAGVCVDTDADCKRAEEEIHQADQRLQHAQTVELMENPSVKDMIDLVGIISSAKASVENITEAPRKTLFSLSPLFNLTEQVANISGKLHGLMNGSNISERLLDAVAANIKLLDKSTKQADRFQDQVESQVQLFDALVTTAMWTSDTEVKRIVSQLPVERLTGREDLKKLVDLAEMFPLEAFEIKDKLFSVMTDNGTKRASWLKELQKLSSYPDYHEHKIRRLAYTAIGDIALLLSDLSSHNVSAADISRGQRAAAQITTYICQQLVRVCHEEDTANFNYQKDILESLIQALAQISKAKGVVSGKEIALQIPQESIFPVCLALLKAYRQASSDVYIKATKKLLKSISKRLLKHDRACFVDEAYHMHAVPAIPTHILTSDLYDLDAEAAELLNTSEDMNRRYILALKAIYPKYTSSSVMCSFWRGASQLRFCMNKGMMLDGGLVALVIMQKAVLRSSYNLTVDDDRTSLALALFPNMTSSRRCDRVAVGSLMLRLLSIIKTSSKQLTRLILSIPPESIKALENVTRNFGSEPVATVAGQLSALAVSQWLLQNEQDLNITNGVSHQVGYLIQAAKGEVSAPEGFMLIRDEFAKFGIEGYRCPNKKACNGTRLLSSSQSQCAQGYMASTPGCAACAVGWGRSNLDPFKCEVCGSVHGEIAALVMAPLVLFGLGMRSARNFTGKRFNPLLKVFLAYCMAASIALNALADSHGFDTMVGDSITKVWLPVSANLADSGSALWAYSFDCLLTRFGAPVSMWLGCALAVPIGILFISFWVCYVRNVARQAGLRETSFSFIQPFLVWGNTFLPGIIGAFMRVLPCVHEQLHPLRYQMAWKLDMECKSRPWWIFATAIGGALTCLLVGPLVWYMLLSHDADWLPESRQSTVTFLTGVYKPHAKYWEVGVLLRKMTLAIIAAVAPLSYSPAVHMLLAQAITSVGLITHTACKPYDDDFLNLIEGISLSSISLAMLSATYVIFDAWSQDRSSTYYAIVITTAVITINGLLLLLLTVSAGLGGFAATIKVKSDA